MEDINESFPDLEPKDLLKVIEWVAFTEYHDDVDHHGDDNGTYE